MLVVLQTALPVLRGDGFRARPMCFEVEVLKVDGLAAAVALAALLEEAMEVPTVQQIVVPPVFLNAAVTVEEAGRIVAVLVVAPVAHCIRDWKWMRETTNSVWEGWQRRRAGRTTTPELTGSSPHHHRKPPQVLVQRVLVRRVLL